MFPLGYGPGSAGFPDNNNSQPPIPASGPMQYSQILITPVVIPSQMVTYDVLIPPNQEQYLGYM